MWRQAFGASLVVASLGCGAKIDLGVSPALTVDAGIPLNGSPGCNQVWTQERGVFVRQPDVTISGGAAIDGGPLPASDHLRGYWVLVPETYDPSTPYRLIFEGSECGDQDPTHTGADGYEYQTVDDGQAIQVGLNADPDNLDNCYDDQNPYSNDFSFFPWLKSQIENELCIDTTKEFISGYSSGAFLANQFGCAFPGELRGQVLVSGGEPGTTLTGGGQPTCVDKPIAAMFVHDLSDADNPYAEILPACERTLKQNGCLQTDCSHPVDGGGLQPYALPSGVMPPIGATVTCSQFTGCPDSYPVVFCTTGNLRHFPDTPWILPAFWDFMKSLN
jgi:hypothetical protein